MNIGSLVRTNGEPNARVYPKSIGIVMGYRDEGLHEMYNTVYVMWPATGEQRSVRQMFLEVVSEGR